MNENPNRTDRAAAYLAGEMTHREAATFERELESDPALRAELETCRAALESARVWMTADAPGVEAADTRQTAPLQPGRGNPAPTATSPSPFLGEGWGGGLRWALQALAACIIFTVGFALGSSTTAPLKREEAARPVQVTAHLPDATPAPSPAVEASRNVTPEPLPARQPVQTQVVDEGGRLVIETTLTGSTARAVWVVDGNFRLEQPGS